MSSSGIQAFISYSSRDLELAREVHRLLMSQQFGYRVWRDERKIEQDWSREIAEALVDSDFVVLLWSTSAAVSKWVRHEWLTARALKKPIVLVLIESAPKLPPQLQNLHGVVTADGMLEPETLRMRIEAQLAAPIPYDFTIRPADLFVPFRPNPLFVGRGSDLVELYLGLIGNLNKVGVTSVGTVGMGGVGKTQLAVEFVYRFSFAFDGIHWMNATYESDWVSNFIALARDELPIEEDNQSPPTNDREWLHALRKHCVKHSGMLIVMDNVRDPDQLNETSMLLGIAPLDIGCNLLFTTRRQFDLPGVGSHSVDLLSPREAYGLLTSRRTPHDDEEAAHAQGICSALGNLPLALALASVYLSHYSTMTFAAYRQKLAESRLDTIDVQKLSSAKLATRHIAAVRATLESQWDVLESPDARRLLDAQRLLDARSLLVLSALMREGEMIPKGRLKLLAGLQQDADALIRPLDDASLLLEELMLAETADEGRALRVHPLIREFVREKVKDKATERSFAADRLSSVYASAEMVEREYADRGLASILEDIALGVQWSPPGPSRSSLELLRRALDTESTNIYRFAHDAHPAFFLQQLANRTVSMGIQRFGEDSWRCLKERKLPHFIQAWRTQRSSPELVRTLVEGSGWVNDIKLTPDGRVLTASEKGTLAVWDLQTGRLIERLHGHDGAVKAIAILEDQNRAVSSGEDGALRLWDLATGEELHTISPHKGGLGPVVVSSEGRSILTAGEDGVLRTWDTRSLSLLNEIGFVESPDALALMPGENQVLVAYFSSPPDVRQSIMNNCGMLDLWDLLTGERLWTRVAHRYVIDAILVLADGHRVLAAGRDNMVRIWDPRTWEDPMEIKVKDPWAAAFIGDGRYVAVGSDRDILVIDIELEQVVHRLKGHSGILKAIDVTDDGQVLASAGCDDTARIWHVKPSAVPTPPPGGGHAEAVTTALALDDVAVTGDYNGELRLWDIQTGDLVGKWMEWSGMRKNAFSAHNGRIVLSSAAELEGGSIKALDLFTRTEHTIWSTGGRVSFLALDSKEKILFIAGGGGAELDLVDAIALSDLRGHGHFIRTIKAPGDKHWLDAAALSADGRFLVVAASQAFGSADDLFLFEVTSGRILASCFGIKEHVQQLVITLEGDMAAFATVSGTLGVWKLDGGGQASIIARELGRDPKLALIGSQRLLVSAAEEICLWNIDRGQARRKLSGHPGVWHLVILSSRELLTASEDWTVTLWDLEAGTEIATLALDNEAREIAVAPNGLTLVIGDGGGDVYTYRLVR